MSPKRIYLAMPVTDFGTVVESVATLELMETYGWEVVSPNRPEHQAGYAAEGMTYFEKVVLSCDAIGFISFSEEDEDLAIGAGVAREILTAMVHGLRVFDLQYDREDDRITPYEFTGGRLHGRILTIDQTKNRIAKIRSERTAA